MPKAPQQHADDDSEYDMRSEVQIAHIGHLDPHDEPCVSFSACRSPLTVAS
jgi:hypothetical protein